MTDATQPILCHVTTAAALAEAGPAISATPFLHCCTEAQLAFVLARHFPGQAGLHIVRFGPACIEGHVEWVRSEPEQDPFPHLFGRLLLAGAATAPA